MIEKIHTTEMGNIYYWTNEIHSNEITLVFLPGLTADHRLFDKQIDYFKEKNNVLVWDAPGHNLSYPFTLDFNLFDKARWLKEIFDKEKITKPVIIGQSMGGYVGQSFIQHYPKVLKGFISIDSAPLARHYTTAAEIWLLKKMEPVYKAYPWKVLLKAGSKGVATTEYGRNLMREMMMVYDKNQSRYASLASHGFKILAEAMEADLPYTIDCPAILICGEKDKAGSAKSYNKKWSKQIGLPIHWIKDAGHNSNTDKPEEVNRIIEDFITDNKKC